MNCVDGYEYLQPLVINLVSLGPSSYFFQSFN